MYGHVVIEMKNDVKTRSTFTIKDTIYDPAATLLSDPEVSILAPIRFGQGIRKFAKTKDLKNLKEEFYEVQMFGKIDVDDIEAFWYQSIRQKEVLKDLFPNVPLKLSSRDLRLENLRDQSDWTF